MAWRRCGGLTSTRIPRPLSDFLIVAIGKLGRGPEAELFARYNARLRPSLTTVELPDGRGAPAEIKRREATALLAAIPANAFTVALDLGAKAPSSETLASQFTSWREAGKPTCFVIGGAEGLDASVIARANHILSLGPLTWPHLLVRVLLAEQLFRAQAIASNHPYHRAGRP
jgi:23S rRNA (pseudouridine1915-N3)-methyltransferase